MSSTPSFATLSLVVLLSLAVAGCVTAPEPNPQFVATGSGGVYFSGWDYEAATLTPLGASLDIDVNEPDNSGLVRAGAFVEDASGQQQPLQIVLDAFSHDTDDFHSGGVAANFDEHGDSGVGNTLLPKMHLLLATWGAGEITVGKGENATKWTDPYTGGSTFAAHLMVTDTGVRNDGDGRVTKADGAAAYDPAAAGDARIGEDNEAHLVFTSTSDMPDQEPMAVDFSGETPGANGKTEEQFEIPIHAGAINVLVDLSGDPTALYNYNFQIRDPDGIAIASKTISSERAVQSATLAANATKAGTYTFYASSLAPGTYSAVGSVTFPPKPVHYFFWEDVEIEQKVVG